ncbi:MAG: tetratricopeptide repeat protein [bacterium]|nr:tetratricopeptide repeat protein [bacterium]
MTAGDQALFHRRGSSRHFLFSKTDTGRLKDVGPKKISETRQALLSAYPDILSDENLTAHVLQLLEPVKQFSCAVIRLDQSGPDTVGTVNPAADGGLIELAELLDAACGEENGVWGTIESGLLAACFPDKNSPQTFVLIRRIQKDFKEKTKKTFTAGIAAYPTITYQKPEILPNAAKALDHATFFGPDSAVFFDSVSLNISGDKLYEEGEIQGAVEELKTALKLDPSNVNVHNSLGVCFGLLGSYKQAIAEFKTAISLEPEEYMPHYNLGLVYVMTDKRDQALELFLKAEKINGDAYEVSFQTGKLYLELDEPEKARLFLERAAELEPKSGAAHRYLADCHAANNQPREAIAAYRKAIKLNPRDAASMSALGCLFEAQGENPEITLMFCRESVGLAPDNALFRYRLGRLYSNQNRLEEALSEFEKARELGYEATDDIKKTNAGLAVNKAWKH